MMRLTCAAMTVAAALAIMPPVEAQPVVKRVITLEQARRVIGAAEAEASRNGWPCVIAVVDDGGWLIALERMDNPAMLASVELASGKARTAALFRKPTADIEKSIDTGRVAAVTAGGFVEMQGGIPLQLGGQIAGAIGVSADMPAHDEQIAEAGVRALEQ